MLQAEKHDMVVQKSPSSTAFVEVSAGGSEQSCGGTAEPAFSKVCEKGERTPGRAEVCAEPDTSEQHQQFLTAMEGANLGRRRKVSGRRGG